MYTEKEYNDAQDFITYCEGVKALQILLLAKQTDGKMLNARDYDLCVRDIKECLDDLFYEDHSEAQEIVDTYLATEQRKHEQLERMALV